MIATSLKILFSVLLIGFLINRVDTSALRERFSNLDSATILLAFLVMAPTVLLQTERFRRVASLGGKLDFRSALTITWIGQLFSQSLPSAMGGDPFRIWYLKRHGVSLRNGFLITLADRVIGFVALFIVLAVGLPWLFSLTDDPLVRLLICLMVAGGFCAWLGACYLDLITPLLPASWRNNRLLSLVIDAPGFLRRASISVNPGLSGILASIAGQAFQVLATYILGRGVGLEPSFLALLFFMPIANLSTLLPLSIGGWGIRELVLVSTLGATGMDAADALALSILTGLANLAISLPGLGFWLTIRR